MTKSKLQQLLLRPCRDADELHRWIRVFLGLNIPRIAVCDGHDAPFDYLLRAYFEPAEDFIVWAPRGGGKTRLAAVATLLDLLHKPGCSVRILGGSLEQSLRMWEHLLPDVQRLAAPPLRARRRSQTMSSRRVRLRNKSSAAVLTQSQRAVRGLRVQKLRCDEVELFDPAVWEAAQLVTKSSVGSEQCAVGREGVIDEFNSPCPQPTAHRPLISPQPTAHRPLIAGTIEALSTFHRPFGLMSRLIDAARTTGSPRVIRWCVLDVLERCPPTRDCAACPLWDDCRGVAKTRCDGFVSIDDAIALKRRVSADVWQSEMLCQRPSTQGSVFPTFDPAIHVRESIQDPPLNDEISTLHLAIDFGFANPFVALWIRVYGAISHDASIIHVIDEYVQPLRALIEHIQQIQLRTHGHPAWIACDPAGGARSEQTAESALGVLRRAGFRVRARRSRILDGLEQIRHALRPAAPLAQHTRLNEPGQSQPPPRLFIHPRCAHLIAAMQQYRYAAPDAGPPSELPLKDGEHDHLVDALRYFFINRKGGTLIVSRY